MGCSQSNTAEEAPAHRGSRPDPAMAFDLAQTTARLDLAFSVLHDTRAAAGAQLPSQGSNNRRRSQSRGRSRSIAPVADGARWSTARAQGHTASMSPPLGRSPAASRSAALGVSLAAEATTDVHLPLEVSAVNHSADDHDLAATSNPLEAPTPLGATLVSSSVLSNSANSPLTGDNLRRHTDAENDKLRALADAGGPPAPGCPRTWEERIAMWVDELPRIATHVANDTPLTSPTAECSES
uniref:Uncharacterized protein n=1 Tax=Neobodo designis TaxID=312471 RepID=A0A7S1M8Z1_NEODS|mmetsp:Transcript_3615/g.11317  ORF Transcript_3615/g.11317 Transcript_3615/m.11317 type:complete len:240 (+) Transcript_3615:93-812(+)|eukprot:CAMPEP_0174854450 /NCGR_PEP_ID=MMETSP1114-20130205/31164_1 /TAXON_ID=312471 /ORGANISM="Neobodo designis, Strain CCAP 1951/1" /LENGTH=239 /DNA_ID=CAMNT_0016089143 /DNA_START=91 /DNA_END=810 /DNA_ORIENTATION=+